MNICIRLVVLGKVKEKFYRDKLEKYYGCINKRVDFKVIELEDESIPNNASQVVVDKIKALEGEKVLEQIKGNDYVVALCIEGKPTDLPLLRKQLDKAVMNQCDNVVFVIGGSLGLDKRVTDRANYKMSFSNMTFPHQLMRVMLAEQLKSAVE